MKLLQLIIRTAYLLLVMFTFSNGNTTSGLIGLTGYFILSLWLSELEYLVPTRTR